MKRQRDTALETVDKLLLSGMNGRLQTNDTLTVWAYSDRLQTNLLSDLAWDPAERLHTANRVFRSLRDTSFSGSPRMEVAMQALRAATNAPGLLTAILVYSGSQPLAGTSFDSLVNEITGRHREEMRKAGKPFVTVLIARDGKYVAYGVTPGGRPVYLPPIPKPPAKPQTPPARVAAPAAPPPATNKPRTLSVEEIEQALRRASPATNTLVAATNPPPSSAPAPGPAASSPTPEVIRPAAPPAPEPGRPEPASPAPAVPAQPPLSATSSPAPSPASPPASAPSAAATAGPPEVRPASSPVAAVASNAVPAAALPPAVVLPPAAPARSWTDLATGLVLLLAAAALAWILLRNLRSRPQPSLISRSLDEER
jgi:hypothetical protein